MREVYKVDYLTTEVNKMFKKLLTWKGLFTFLPILIALVLAIAFSSDVIAKARVHFFPGNMICGSEFRVKGTKTATMRMCYLSGTEIRIDAPGSPLLSQGLAGTDELGGTEGVITLAESTDMVRYTVQLPDLYIKDQETAGELVFEWDIDEFAGDAGPTVITVAIYEYGETTAIITDTISIVKAVVRGWVTLASASTGIGDDDDIDAGDTLLITLTPVTNDDNFYLYGCRVTYATGIETDH